MNPNQQTEVTIVHDKTFEVIKSAVNKLCNFIRPTFGPATNKVIISKILNRGVFDDGVQIARDYELSDPAENAIVNIIREVAIRTNDRVGDGTTGSLLMLQSIINEVGHKTRFNGRQIEKELKRGLEEVKAQLLKQAKKIKTKEEFKKVALVAFDDEKIAEMIADLYVKLGNEGTITIAKSPIMETTVEMSEGIKIDKGYIANSMVINPERMETVLEKPYILLTDYRITEANDLLPIMNQMIKENKRELVIICDNLEQNALATAIVNRMQNIFLIVAVALPKDQKITLEDMALMTGSRLFSESKGDKLELASIKDLGRSERFICRRDESIIVGPKGKKSDIATAINSLRTAIKSEQDEKKKNEMMKRLSGFTNSIAVIKVGAPTQNEQKTLNYKVEDAVQAVKAAGKSGVVCGAGRALAQVRTSSSILNEALQYPSQQLMENMGLPESLGLDDDHVMNVVTGKVGPFMGVGVIDPVDVLIAGVESAVSIASILITSSGIICEAPKKPPII